MIKTYLRIGIAVAAVLAVAWAINTGYDHGYSKAKAEQAEAVQKAVAEARAEWDAQVEADRQITDRADEREVEIREVEKIVYRDIIKWRAPDACRDLGADFRRLFNAGARPADPDTTEAD